MGCMCFATLGISGKCTYMDSEEGRLNREKKGMMGMSDEDPSRSLVHIGDSVVTMIEIYMGHNQFIP